MDFSNYIKFEGNLIQGSPTRITYSGYLFENGSESVSMVYGFGSHWEHTNEIKMEKTEDGFTAEVEMLNYALFNFCFKNGNNQWDNNYGGNYVFEVTEKVVESAFILNENVISEILENLFEINISEIEERNAISAPIVEATVEPVHAEPVVEEFEVSYEKTESVSIEDSLVTSTDATTLNNDIEQLFNEIYQPEIQETTTTVVIETVEQEDIQTVEEVTPVEVENVQTIETAPVEETPVVESVSEKQSLLSDILADKATPQEVVEVKEEKLSFNMNSLIDEILSPIISSSSFEVEELGDEYSSLQTAEDEKVNEVIDNLITEIQQTVEEKTNINYIEETKTYNEIETIEEVESDFNDDEVSLIETLANEAREEVASKASTESTALIEVSQPDSFLVSARSLGKFYMFKKRVKLVFYKLFKTLPKMLSADFFEENNK